MYLLHQGGYYQFNNIMTRGSLFRRVKILYDNGSLSHDFKIWPITFQGSGPSGAILLAGKKSHFYKNTCIYLKASLRTPQNRKYM